METSKRDPAFLFYDGDAARDVSHMTRLERGAYFDVIQAQRKFHGITTEQLRKVLGKDYEEVWPALELILSHDESGYFITWVRNSENERAAHAQKQRKRIQDYWDKKRAEANSLSLKNDSTEISRNNHGNTMESPRKYRGISTDIPLEEEEENEIEEEEEIVLKGGVGEKTWRNDFSIYFEECSTEYQALRSDISWIKEREKFHPGVDILLSLEKAYTEFWSTQLGWKHKKKSRAASIYWKSTFTKALDLPSNKVYNNGKRTTSNSGDYARKQSEPTDSGNAAAKPRRNLTDWSVGAGKA